MRVSSRRTTAHTAPRPTATLPFVEMVPAGHVRRSRSPVELGSTRESWPRRPCATQTASEPTASPVGVRCRAGRTSATVRCPASTRASVRSCHVGDPDGAARRRRPGLAECRRQTLATNGSSARRSRRRSSARPRPAGLVAEDERSPTPRRRERRRRESPQRGVTATASRPAESSAARRAAAAATSPCDVAVGRQRLVLAQDRRLEVPQLLARLKPELVAQAAANRLVDVERVGLPSRAVEASMSSAAPAPGRVRGRERLELSDERARGARAASSASIRSICVVSRSSLRRASAVALRPLEDDVGERVDHARARAPANAARPPARAAPCAPGRSAARTRAGRGCCHRREALYPGARVATTPAPSVFRSACT